eukprot:4424964-Amphidinium_carterae.1
MSANKPRALGTACSFLDGRQSSNSWDLSRQPSWKWAWRCADVFAQPMQWGLKSFPLAHFE